MTRSCTQLAHREPPYERLTDFWGFEIWEYSRGRRAGSYGYGVSRDVPVLRSGGGGKDWLEVFAELREGSVAVEGNQR